MTDLTLDAARLTQILKKVSRDLQDHTEELRQLDSVAGDGDLGVTVELISQALDKSLESGDTRDIGRLLANCGMKINSLSPSTFGTLVATAFLGAGKALIGREEIEIKDLGPAGEAAVESVKKRGKSDAGDKTLLDSLIPSVKAFGEVLARTGSPQDALKSASQAAHEGMQSTINMPAKFGRASWRPDRCIGVQDAGATAMYYLIDSFARNLLFFVENGWQQADRR